MEFGIDTFDYHLDLIKFDVIRGHPDKFTESISYNEFKKWNGGKPLLSTPPKVEGGDPVFAGRNFLGGDFIWGHAEATDALISPQPKDFSKINLIVNRIAPIQAPIPNRQKVTGYRGFLFGQIDANAICTRLSASILDGEFKLPSAGFVHVWLAVDPFEDLSLQYWIGWSDTVNNFPLINPNKAAKDPAATPKIPFAACIRCQYTRDTQTGKLKRDPHVTSVLNLAVVTVFGDFRCHALWSDALDPNPERLRPNPTLDWNLFDPTEKPTPSLWRFATEFREADGTAVDDISFAIDAVRPPEFEFQGASKETDYMLIVQKWEPSIPSPFLHLGCSASTRTLTDQQIKVINATVFPDTKDLSRNYTVPKDHVSVIGRYLRDKDSPLNLKAEEAKRLSVTGIKVFSCWQHTLAGMANPPAEAHSQPTELIYFDPAQNKGTRDGADAFRYCAQKLRQPPHTPVFFAVDLICPAESDGHPGLSLEQAKERFKQYFQQIKDARDRYAEEDPDHYYLIGVYACGAVLQWCYEDGIVNMFWQSLSTGRAGNRFPSRPWPHANRFQFTGTDDNQLPNQWAIIPTADPEVDWGDGGAWSLTDPLVQNLTELEQREETDFFQKVFPFWANLLDLPGGHP